MLLPECFDHSTQRISIKNPEIRKKGNYLNKYLEI